MVIVPACRDETCRDFSDAWQVSSAFGRILHYLLAPIVGAPVAGASLGVRIKTLSLNRSSGAEE